RYLRRHAMTWQEVMAEAREAEGSPEMRAQLRSRQQQAGRGGAAQAGVGADAMSPPSPQPSPSKGEHPEGHKGANAGPTSIDEVIG
ncbi:MAG TPA: EscU/YscU/HrcU family type III secretion system export apparatus switch protein, partial [Steroidobacteraceae bacterium]|nr:EscU/YscU/HrcU family type III secretion system export apparatus switch protein [Steroidobacteraceae bacterium]